MRGQHQSDPEPWKRESKAAQEARPDDGSPLQRIGVLVELPRLLEEMNVAPAPLLASLGLSLDALSDIEGRLPFPLVSELTLKCTQTTGRPDFMLLVGAEARLRHLGVVGQLLTFAPDFGTALLDFVANHRRYVRGAGVYLIDRGDDGVMIGHRVHHPGLLGSTIFSAAATAFGIKVFAELAAVEPAQVTLSLPQPDDVRPYRQIFGRSRLVFEAEHMALVYPRAALKKPIPTANPARYEELRAFVSERWNYLQPDIADRVMRVLVPSVLAGKPSLATIAQLLVMHPRALNRALQARGLSFREAVKRARFEMASQLLRETQIGIAELSQILGYSEVSAFTRFFTSMAGLPPTEWKARESAKRGD
jgi:AraC-like DNA-binding protein